MNEFEQTPWEFWTSSPAFHLSTPKTRGLVRVPLGETWVCISLSLSLSLQIGQQPILFIPIAYAYTTLIPRLWNDSVPFLVSCQKELPYSFPLLNLSKQSKTPLFNPWVSSLMTFIPKVFILIMCAHLDGVSVDAYGTAIYKVTDAKTVLYDLLL